MFKIFTLALILAGINMSSAKADVDPNNSGCDGVLYGSVSGGENRIILTLQPGETRAIQWDFTKCWVGIQNFNIFVNQERPCPSCRQSALKKGTPITLTAVNVTTGDGPILEWPWIKNMGYADHSIIEATVSLAANAKSSVKLEITQSATWGGVPIR